MISCEKLIMSQITGQKEPEQQIGSKNAKHFGLLDLAPEIWSKIGKMVIDNTPPCTEKSINYLPVVPERSRAKRFPLDSAIPPSAQQPPLTRVCKVLREELLPYYYGTKISIDTAVWCTISGLFARWLRNIGPDNRRMVRGVTLHSFLDVASLEELGKQKWEVDLRVEPIADSFVCKVVFM